ncbi:MAG: ferritin-like domain-containing protein [Bacillota bacterium]
MSISKESFDLAIELEEKGHDYYEENAKKTNNPMAKSILESLANQELDHIETIKQIASGKEVENIEVHTANIEEEAKEAFESFTAKEREDWEEFDEEIYKHALEFEEDIYDLYADLAEKSEGQEKEFFEALMEEENSHYESIQNALYYLTNNSKWLDEEESKVWNWMNI